MPAIFLIPLAGLALGALGQLFRQQRSADALSAANGTASAGTPSETGLSTAASQRAGSGATVGNGRPAGASNPTLPTPGQSSVASQQSTASAAVDPTQNQTSNGGDSVSATQPATGPVQQNASSVTPTPASGDNAGLAARLGSEAIAKSKTKNKSQQASVSNAALK